MQESESTQAFVSDAACRDHIEPGVRIDEESRPEIPATLGHELAGELAFASAEAQAQRTAELLGDGAIVVIVAEPPASMRGRLADHIDAAIERQLGVHGADPPYETDWSGLPEEAGARLVDQLARARSVGGTGIALVMGSLARIAAPALTPEDSATMRGFATAARSGAVVVLVDDGDARVGGFGEAIALEELLGVGVGVSERERESESERIAVSVGAEKLLDLDLGELVETHVDAPVAVIAAVVHVAAPVVEEKVIVAESATVVEEKVIVAEAAHEVRVDEGDRKRAARRRATAGVPAVGPSDFWRSWAIALGAARGPQPLAAFEKLFTESYMPLANAIACGVDDPRAMRAHDEFRDGFERSYTDAFVAFAATGRRPRLVMDAFDVASKQARLHGARSTQVLVVDAMRYDIGCHVRDELALRAGGIASLTSESLLWSALPTTTYRQLETLARGMDALRAPAPEDGTESLRGRSAETVRRMRVGSRELFKLDAVPAMLSAIAQPSEGPAAVIGALRGIATHVADAVMRHLETLPPRTLLLVLGDHGFAVDRHGAIADGGASPEEVLVPSLAYLVGDLH